MVPDAWELPHTCLKIGRTLGSGEFGQVVRGRISRSLLLHRGIDLHGTGGKSGMFVTAAVKMLQGKNVLKFNMLNLDNRGVNPASFDGICQMYASLVGANSSLCSSHADFMKWTFARVV